MATCRLCLGDKPLCLSHIIPNFFTKQMKNEAGIANKYLVLDANKQGTPGRGQGGVKEQLFCAECEALLNERYEKYAYNLLYVRGFEYGEMGSKQAKLAINIDYTRFKLFLLSILFRASISSHEFCSVVDIGRLHEEEIRKMLLYSDPKQPHNYPILISCVYNNGEVIKDWVLQPSRSRFDMHNCYQFILGSYLYLFIVSSHRVNKKIDSFVLNINGTAVIMNQDLKKIKNVMSFLGKVIQNSIIN